ncbi:MAG: HAMP domain-containing sensor histidine kinase, partial [Eubacteriales bacterium]
YFAAAIFAVLTAWVTTSFFKRVKSGEVIKYSLIYKAFDLILRFSRKVLNRFKRCFTVAVKPFITLANKTIKRKYIFSGVLLTAILYFNAIILMVMGVTNNFILVFLWLVFTIPFIAILVVVFCLSQMEEFEAIKKGSGQIRKGNLLYKIPPCKNAEINQVAEDINNIGDGLNAAVRNAISSEKLKTELITNVSHDLKTPLTSIIEYINLISQEDGLSPEVKDYLGVLKNKSERLNNIISDLFDLSKSASGNSELIIEKLDLKKLVVQTLADMDDKVVNSGHVVKQSLPETEVFINADGKKLYRVFQNVIDNALKYALEGTRIFIDLKVVGLKAIVEIHNTASYEMDFTEQEILERFTRGDKSRTTDGTGLGLSIAETFTKACGGDFNIKIDGDQFRVIIEFNIL